MAKLVSEAKPRNRKFLPLILAILVVSGFAFSAYQTITLLDTQAKLSDARATIQSLNQQLANLTAPQPKIVLTDIAIQQGCGIFGGNTLRVEFSLVNTGKADGFARTQMFVDGNPVAENTYFVRMEQTVTKLMSFDVNDCNSHDISVKIVSVAKA